VGRGSRPATSSSTVPASANAALRVRRSTIIRWRTRARSKPPALLTARVTVRTYAGCVTVHLLPAPVEGSVLDRRTLNRTLLARQHLLARVSLGIAQTVEHLVGLQAQNPRDPYTALWSRLDGFDPLELSALLETRDAVRLTIMRGTLHLVRAVDAGPLRAVMQADVGRMLRSSVFWRNLRGADVDAIVARGTRLVEERPRSVAELSRLLSETWPDRDPDSLGYAVRYLVPLVQATPRGLWDRSGAARVTTLRAWLGSPRLPEPDPGSVVLRYLRAFGPASVSDIRAWSGLTGLRPVVDGLRPQLRSYRDEAGRELLDVPDGTFADGAAPAPVRFLPEFDNVFLSHADRSRVTGDGRWDARFARRGVLLADGFLAAAWRLVPGDGAVALEIEPFVDITPSVRDEVRHEGDALLRFLRPNDRSRAVRFARSG
jgi:DNA glycosylase AlkZ-like